MDNGFAIIAIIGGILILVGLYAWARQRHQLGIAGNVENMLRDVPLAGNETDAAVLVSTEHGQLVYTNTLARRWLQLDGSIPDLEYVAGLTDPVDSFLDLLTREGQAAFQILDRWVEASSHAIPSDSGPRTVIVMRELSNATTTPDSLNLSLAMSIINQIGEMVNASMGLEQVLQILLELVIGAVPADAGEICIWDEGMQMLHQRGWTGDTRYLLVMAELGGGYQIGQGVAGWIARYRKPMMITDHNDPTAIAALDRNPYEAIVAVPLQLGEQFVGTLTLFSNTPGRFSQADMALLQAISRSSAMAIHNTALYTRQVQRIQDLAGLQQIPRTQDTQAIYEMLNKRIAELLEADMCGIFIYDDNRKGLIPQPPFHGLQNTVAQMLFITLPEGSPQHDIWLHQTSWLSNDLVDEPIVEALGLKPVAEVAGIRNTLLMPLEIGSSRIGAVAVSNKRSESGFKSGDIQNLRVLSAQAAIVVENLRLFEREKRIGAELTGLQEMTHAIGALSHGGEFYAEINERIARLMQCAMCGILLYDAQDEVLRAQLPFYGVDESLVDKYEIPLPAGSVMDELWTDDTYWYSNRVESEAIVFEAGLDDIADRIGVSKTLICTLVVGGKKMGVVQVSNKLDDSDFTTNDARLLQIFATQAAAIIENARLVTEVQRSANQAEGLRRIAEMAGGLLTSEESFEPVLAEISNLTNSPVVFVNVLDHITGSLVTQPNRVYGNSFEEIIRHDIHTNDFDRSVAVSGQPFISNDIVNDDRVIAGYKMAISRFGLEKAILVPLTVGDRHLGELGVANRPDAPYTEADLSTLQTVASQIAAALERLLMYEATGENLRRRVEELDAVSRVSAELTLTVDLDRVLDVIRHEAVQTAKADGGTIVLLRPQDMWVNADHPEMDRRIGDSIALEQLADIEFEAVARGADSLLVTDYAESDMQPLPKNVRSAVAAAILHIDQIVGVIHLHAEDPNRFDDRAATFLMTLSTKASLAYQNAQRYQEQIERSDSLRRRVDQLNRIFELGQMLQSSADTDSVLEAVAYSVQQSIGFDTVLMLLIDEEAGVLRRKAQAGMPLNAFETTRSHVITVQSLEELQADEFRISDSYFFPIEDIKSWYVEDVKALSTTYEGNRSMAAGGKKHWRDGDMLLVNIRGSGGNLVGVMSVDRPFDGMRPDRNIIEMLEIFGHQASAMIENTRLFQASVRNAEQESNLNDLMEAIASTLELTEIVDAVAVGTRQMVAFDRLTVAIEDPDGEGFNLIKVDVRDDDSQEISQENPAALERTALGRTYSERHEYDYQLGDDEIKTYEDLRAWYASGEKESVIVPLISGGECVGAMHVGSKLLGTSTLHEQHSLISRIAQLVAGAVQNARLFSRAINLQVLNQSVVESIQQGIVVLDNSGRIVAINDFMRNRYGWEDQALRKDLFIYKPEMAEALKEDMRLVLENGVPHERIGQTSADAQGLPLVTNFYLYPLRSGDTIRGAVLLVEDVTERAKLEQAIESRANQLAALTEVSTRISASLDRSEVIGLALEEMGWIIPFDTMTVWRRTGPLMVLEGASGFESGEIETSMTIRFKDHERINQIIESQRVVSTSSDAGLADEGLPGEPTAKSWMGVPLVSQGHVVGMILLMKDEPDFYETRSEQHVAQAFASQVAIALANAELFEQMFDRTNELGTLLEAAQATSMSLDLDEVFRTVVELMFNALEMDNCTIVTWDEVDYELEVQVDINRDGNMERAIPPGTRLSLRDYPAKEHAIQKREVVVIADRTEGETPPYPRELNELRERGYGARMIVPLIVGDQSRGIIQLEQFSNDEQTLTQQKVRLARALGTQVAVAIENARLSTETTTRFQELLTINELSRSISATLRLEDMIHIVREQVPNVTEANEIYLALYNPETKEITFPMAVRHGEEFEIPRRMLGNDEVSYIIKNRRSLNLGADYFGIDDLRKSMGIVNGEGNAKSYMGVPLIAGDEVLGVLAVRDDTRTRAFNVSDENILTTVGSQLGAAIQNARLFTQVSEFAQNLNRLVEEQTEELEQERDRLDTLYQITSELARTLDMGMLSERALGMVSKAVSAEDGVILLSDPITDKLYSRAALNPHMLVYDEREDRERHPAELLANWLIQNDEHDNVIVVDDLHQVDYWDQSLPGAEQWRSALAVLLEMNEDPMGVMVLLSSKPEAFTETQLKLMVAAANQVAASINNADLYQLIRDQAERLGTLLRAEQEDAERSNAILESIADGVMLADSNGVITLFNTAAERILQLPRDQALGQPLSKLTGIYGTSAIQWERQMTDWSNDPDPERHGEFMDQRLDLGDRVVSVHLSPVYIGDQFLGTVSVFRDITREVEVDRMKSEFITSVSHEFRTPLTPIKGFTDLLLMGAAGSLAKSQADMLGSIKSNVDRLSRLVNDVLDIARLDSNELELSMQLVNLEEVVPTIVERIANTPANSKKDIITSVEVEPGLPYIRADRDKFFQIITNLVDNAFNYTLTGGRIGVTVKRQGPNDKFVLIAVADTGVGIPQEFHEAIWRRFERYEQHALELDVAGTGLGLPLVKELITRHHGRVWFESEMGVGTTFFVELPVEQPNYITGTIEVPQINTETVGD